jgi:hypothetical protein
MGSHPPGYESLFKYLYIVNMNVAARLQTVLKHHNNTLLVPSPSKDLLLETAMSGHHLLLGASNRVGLTVTFPEHITFNLPTSVIDSYIYYYNT